MPCLESACDYTHESERREGQECLEIVCCTRKVIPMIVYISSVVKIRGGASLSVVPCYIVTRVELRFNMSVIAVVITSCCNSNNLTLL